MEIEFHVFINMIVKLHKNITMTMLISLNSFIMYVHNWTI